MKKVSKKEKARRERMAELDARRKPRLLWDSSKKGTYVKKEHGPLCAS